MFFWSLLAVILKRKERRNARERERERWSWGLGGMEERDLSLHFFPMNDALDLFEREKCSYVLLPPEDQT